MDLKGWIEWNIQSGRKSIAKRKNREAMAQPDRSRGEGEVDENRL